MRRQAVQGLWFLGWGRWRELWKMEVFQKGCEGKTDPGRRGLIGMPRCHEDVDMPQITDKQRSIGDETSWKWLLKEVQWIRMPLQIVWERQQSLSGVPFISGVVNLFHVPYFLINYIHLEVQANQ